MNRKEYFNQKHIVIRNLLLRRFSKTFLFEYETDRLITKNTKKTTYNRCKLDFQSKLLEKKRTQKKKVIKSSVGVEVIVQTFQKNTPQVQNIVKCYIDFLYENSSKPNLILKDDKQIKYLHVKIEEKTNPNNKITFRVFPYHLLEESVRLLTNLGYNDKDAYNQNYDISSFESWKEAYWDSKESEWYRSFSKRQIQDSFLEFSQIRNDQICSIVSNCSELKSQIVFRRPCNLTLKKLPKETGETKEFISRLRNQVAEFFKKWGVHTPFLTPIELVILTTSIKDLDNIAIWVIKEVMKELNPPSSVLDALGEKEKSILKSNTFASDLIDKPRLLQKNAVNAYEIIELPESRISNDEIVITFQKARSKSSFYSYLGSCLTRLSHELDY